MSNPKGNVTTLKSYKPVWRSGVTRTIRVPVVLAEQVVEYVRQLDSNHLTHVNTHSQESQDNHEKVIALLQQAITPKAKGGSYASNNAGDMKKLVEQALALLNS